jgi:hypothetical protein
MYLISENDFNLFENFETIGLKNEIKNNQDVLIKINLSRPYSKNFPKTDMVLLRTVIDYIYRQGGRCAITEGANGYLKENLIASGFENALYKYKIDVIDVDLEDYDEVSSFGECHYIPKCFRNYPIRIAIPSCSKRQDMLYSNNIKLFAGAVPRKMYQIDDTGKCSLTKEAPRPKLHQNLHLSVANLFYAIQMYSPFHFFINGGLSFNENIGEFHINKLFIGNNALELDSHLFQTYFNDCEYPDYMRIVESRGKRD